MTKFIQSVLFLLHKEFLLEWRQKYALGGILLYVCSTVFVVYAANGEIQPEVWNSLFWIVILFTSVNAVMKSFVQENSNRALYYYQLADPIAVLVAKMIYNILLLLLLSLLAFGAFILFISNPVLKTSQFFLALFLGGMGFSIALTFISAIASKATNSATLMAVLAFPVILPILLSVIQLSSKAFLEASMRSSNSNIATLAGIDLILLAFSLVLFPFLWRE